MNDPVQAVVQVADAEDWGEKLPPLPTDYLALFTTALPLFGKALFIGFFVLRSLR